MPSTERVHHVLEQADEPRSCKAVAEKLGCDWHTAKNKLDALMEQGRAHSKTVHGSLTLYSDQPIDL